MSIVEMWLEADDVDRARRVFERAPEVLKEAMRLANMESSKVLIAQIKDQKLRGQVLRRISGTLIRSWAAKVPPTERDGAWNGGAGTRLNYAIFHEFGFDGTVTVREHTRRAARTRTASGRFRKRPEGAGVAHVQTYAYEKHYAGKPYARPALEEVKDRIREIHHERLVKADGGMGSAS